MTLPVVVQADNGHFSATVLGAPELRAHGATRAEAIETLRQDIDRRCTAGDLVMLDVAPAGAAALAGLFKDDPTLREICDEAYRLRDAERDSGDAA